MDKISKEQIRQFRLHTHHLDTWYQQADVKSIAGACGFQNSPPGAWEIALHNRIPDCKQDDMKQMLDKTARLSWTTRQGKNKPGRPFQIPVWFYGDEAKMLKTELQDLVDGYALFQQLTLDRITFLA